MAERRLIWSDEFEGDRLDPEKWSAAHDCWGGGNDERQCYQPANVQVSDGRLRIVARKERGSGPSLPPHLPGSPRTLTRDYTSGKVQTRGKASFRYGRVEVRARLPEGQGLWSAIWMLPEHDNYGPYPQSGEIDIAEVVNLGARCRFCRGGREHRVHGAIHHGWSLDANRQIGGSRPLPPTVDGFHVFALDWSPARMTWSVDDEAYFSTPGRRPFDQRFHLILNLAVGGSWPESHNARGVDDAALPATMEIDWVRVYED